MGGVPVFVCVLRVYFNGALCTVLGVFAEGNKLINRALIEILEFVHKQGALHVRQMAEHYGVPVILHSDHCAKKLLPWFDGMLEADEKHFKEHGTPLFSSHMLDLSAEPHEEVPKIDLNTESSKEIEESKSEGFAETMKMYTAVQQRCTLHYNKDVH